MGFSLFRVSKGLATCSGTHLSTLSNAHFPWLSNTPSSADDTQVQLKTQSLWSHLLLISGWLPVVSRDTQTYRDLELEKP